jgi:hypothetical protein
MSVTYFGLFLSFVGVFDVFRDEVMAGRNILETSLQLDDDVRTSPRSPTRFLSATIRI